MKTRRHKADALFSEYIRARDPICQYCMKNKSIHTHHHFGRSHFSVRFDEENCIGLCGGCHIQFHSNPLLQVEFWKRRIGKQRYEALSLRANNYEKRDFKMAEIKIKALMGERKDGRNRN